jgi:hypothetical protein
MVQQRRSSNPSPTSSPSPRRLQQRDALQAAAYSPGEFEPVPPRRAVSPRRRSPSPIPPRPASMVMGEARRILTSLEGRSRSPLRRTRSPPPSIRLTPAERRLNIAVLDLINEDAKRVMSGRPGHIEEEIKRFQAGAPSRYNLFQVPKRCSGREETCRELAPLRATSSFTPNRLARNDRAVLSMLETMIATRNQVIATMTPRIVVSLPTASRQTSSAKRSPPRKSSFGR